MIIHLINSIRILGILSSLSGVTFGDTFKLLRKSINLYLVLIAFTDKHRPREQLKQVMICAVISAVYDYDSDWQEDETGRNTQILLNRFVEPQLRDAAMNLFRVDVTGKLSRDGFERGSVALRLYRNMIQADWMSRYTDEEIDRFGRKLQIIDDLLDLEDDRNEGQQNCFLLEEWRQYARELEEFLECDFFHALMNNHWSYRKLEKMLRERLAQLRKTA